MEALINKVKRYQEVNGTEFDPQIVLFKLSGCSICKSFETELMIDGWNYEAFDCMEDKHSDLADELESTLNTNRYPIIFILYPEPKVITINDLDPDINIIKQISKHL